MTDEQRAWARRVKRRIQLVLLQRTIFHLSAAVLAQLFANEVQTYALNNEIMVLVFLAFILFFASGWQFGAALINAYRGYQFYNTPLEDFNQ